jgi:hypothetical protein
MGGRGASETGRTGRALRIPNSALATDSFPEFILGWTLGQLVFECSNNMKAEDVEIWKSVLEVQKKMRPYAPFFNWPDKQIKELGVVDCLLQAIREQEGRNWIKETEPGPDVNLPPDVIGITHENTRVAFEVTELIDQSNIDKSIKRQTLKFQDWQPDEIINRLELILADKGLIDFGKGSFASVVLVIHTDELQISLDQCRRAIAIHQFVQREQIDEAYLIFRPVPMGETCPYFRLSFK